MLPVSVAALWFASSAAGAVVNGRRNDSAPFLNITLSSTGATLSSETSSSSETAVVVASSSILRSASQYVDPVTETSLSRSPEPTTFSDAPALSLQQLPANTSAPPDVSASPSLDVELPVNATSSPQVSASPTPDLQFPVNTTESLSAPFPNVTASSTTKVSNASCTVNIPSASIDYWYPATYSHYIGTMTTAGMNYSNTLSYTALPEATPFDAASALATDWACTSSTYYVSEWDFTATQCYEYTAKPTAAATTVVSRTQYAPFPPEGVIPIEDARFYDIYTDPGPLATVEITVAPNVTQTQASATPFVYFTAYEVESGNGTETIQLPSAQIYSYTAKGLEDAAIATGSLPEGFLEQIPQSACDGGVLVGSVTVLIVVDLIWQNWPNADPFIIHFESTAIGFEDPPPVTIADQRSDRPPPMTMDWNWPSPSVRPNQRPDPPAVPTTPANNAGTRETQLPNFPQPSQVTVGTIGNVPVVVGPSSEVVVGSQTLRPGGPPITVGNQPVSLAPSPTAIVVGGTTSRLPEVFPAPDRAPPVITIGSSTFVPNAATQFFIAPGQTLTPGGVVTHDGTVISLAPSASFIVIDGASQALPTRPPGAAPTGPPQIIVGGNTITAQPTAGNPNSPGPSFVLDGQTLLPGGPALTVSGTTLSLAPSASFIVVDGVTSTLSSSIAPHITPPPLTIGSGIFRPLPGDGTSYLIGSSTLTPGGQVVVAGTTISLAPGATALVVNGQTTALLPITAAPVTNAPLLTIGSETYTAVSGTTFVIEGQTLTPGGVITVDGTTISLAPGATQLVYGSDGLSTTTALFPATTTRSQSITSTVNPSARASNGPGQAAPTTQGNAAPGTGSSRTAWEAKLAAVFVAAFLSI